MATCPYCAEATAGERERCGSCGSLLVETEAAPPRGFPRDSLAVATTCVLAAALLVGWAAWNWG